MSKAKDAGGLVAGGPETSAEQRSWQGQPWSHAPTKVRHPVACSLFRSGKGAEFRNSGSGNRAFYPTFCVMFDDPDRCTAAAD
jgi:hypothetical protein